MKYADGIAKSTQIKFGGLNHCTGAGDGELWDMQNMTSDHAPVLATRQPRRLYKTLAEPGGLFSWDKLCWVDGTGFYYDGQLKGQVSAGQKRFGCMGSYIVILPDKCYYNVNTDEFGDLGAYWEGEKITFGDGLYAEVAAEANMIQAEGVDWAALFKPGDAVTINGCTVNTANNKTAIIHDIDGDKLYFLENAFKLTGDEGTESYSEEGELRIAREIPDLEYIWENENRLWGCDGLTIYACEWDNVFNWNVLDGTESASWQLTPTSAGMFTGVISYKGFPIFFKEDHIYKVYGSTNSTFQVMGSASLGLAEGSGGSLAIAGETLFYLHRTGIMAYGGGIPQPISEIFGTQRFSNAVAGSDGIKYYVSMQAGDGSWGLYVYDTQRGLWHKEDDTRVTHFAKCEGYLCYLNEKGEIWVIGDAEGELPGEPESPVEWFAEFADFTQEDPNVKGVGKLQLRLELDAGATAQVWIQFDSDGEWIRAGDELSTDVKRSYYLPVVPRRCDHYRLKISGTGGCRIFSLTREFYTGSEFKTRRGRN